MTSSEFTGVIFGGIIGLGSSMVILILSNELSKRRTDRKANREREENRIAEIYSPLIFIIDNNRNFFSKIFALKNTSDDLVEEIKKDDKETLQNLLDFLIIIFSEGNYSKNMKRLLYNKLGMFENKDIRIDLFLYTSYLDTMQEYIKNTLAMSFTKLPKIINSISSIASTLEDASVNIKELAMSKTSKVKNYHYKLFFNEKIRNDIDADLDKINMELFGTPILDWDRMMRMMKK